MTGIDAKHGEPADEPERLAKDIADIAQKLAIRAIDKVVMDGEVSADSDTFPKRQLAGVAFMGTWVSPQIIQAFWGAVRRDERFIGVDHRTNAVRLRPVISPESTVRPSRFAIIAGTALESTEEERRAAWDQAYHFGQELCAAVQPGQEFTFTKAVELLRERGLDLDADDKKLLKAYMQLETHFIKLPRRYKATADMGRLAEQIGKQVRVGQLKELVDVVLRLCERDNYEHVVRRDVLRALTASGVHVPLFQFPEVTLYMKTSPLLVRGKGTRFTFAKDAGKHS